MPVNIALRCHSNKADCCRRSSAWFRRWATQELDTYSVGPAVGSGVSTIVVAEWPGRRPSSSKI